MPKYLIERELPGAGRLSSEQLQAISQKSCGVLRDLGSDIQWLHSYVTGDKIYCVYIAKNEALVREHASRDRRPELAQRIERGGLDQGGKVLAVPYENLAVSDDRSRD